uniref:Dedicator of cytokinesis 3 n=1 Tax=Astyanax mexicanus TaxID=7994 RepID=A0A8B9L2W6_ASTMX
MSGLSECVYVYCRQCETVVPLEDPIITESTSTLQEWGVLWKQLYVKHRVELFQKLRHVMSELMDLRRQLISGHMTQEQSREVKRHITLRLDWGNEHLGLDLVPRKEFEMVDPDQFSVSDLYKMVSAWQSCPTDCRMLLNDSKKGPPHVQYRRPYGCAALAMSDVFSSITDPREEKDFVLKIYTCNNESEWYQIHENIIRKSSTKYSAPSTNYGLIVSLQLFRGDLDTLRRENHLMLSRGVTLTRKLGFPDVILPGDSRNDLYLTLERGDFERGGKSVQKNIEVTVYVLYADGETLKDCISVGCGEPSVSEHHSFVLYHNNSPRWSESLKLPIPIERFRGSHLRFEFRHCSTKDKGEKKLFGFAFTPLMREDGTTLLDECHELYVYKCDENTTFSNQGLYLSMPCCKADLNSCPAIPASFPFQRSNKESFSISTLLASTKLTQNVDLLTLLKWKANPERVLDILGRLRLISGEEIVKFLQDVLDTLFSLLDDNIDKYGPLVFQSLVFIINLLRDPRYYHFRPVMDAYTHNQFAGALAYKELIRCLKWYMDRSAEVVRQDHIQDAMRALEYLFKFIVQSRALYSRATCGLEEEQFRASIQELFHSIRFLLSLDGRNAETLVVTQAALLNSFPDIFDELLQMFTVQEVAELVRGTLASMPGTVDIGQSMDEFLLKIFCVFRNLMKLSVFPRDWSIMRLLTSHLAVLFVSQPSLQLESLSQVKRKRILDKYEHTHTHPHFTPGMMGPFLGVTLVPQTEVRNIMIPIFHDMMDWEQRKNGNFKQVEAELMDKLDSMMSDGKGEENHRELFGLLTQLFGPYPSLLEKMEQETWRETGVSFITSVTRLIERLLDYRCVCVGEETESKKLGANIMNFYKCEITKEDMYIRYIHKLCDLHLQMHNYTEAAFTLLLYWELLQWSEQPLRDLMQYPAQSQWQRKETLSRKILHYFNKGKCWEYGISLCRELALQYEMLYDYHSLSWIRKMEASFYDNIIEQQRLEPEFFRMGFYGRKFPFFLRNKEFVCRGYDYERLEDFQQRMLTEFPQAIALQQPNLPDDSIQQSDAQYLQIYAVTPVSELSDGPMMDRVPERIKSFYRINNVSRFHYDRPFHKGPKDRENEFRSLWIERTTLVLCRPLPGISRWFEVERREVMEVSPLENAIYVVENKNQELRTLISQYQHRHHHGNISLLSMCLNGVIDAAVNGGIARYQEAFFDKDYISSHPEEMERINQLKELMQEQVHILGVGLAVHEKLVHPEMRPLHKKLVDQFHVMRSGLSHVSIASSSFLMLIELVGIVGRYHSLCCQRRFSDFAGLTFRQNVNLVVLLHVVLIFKGEWTNGNTPKCLGTLRFVYNSESGNH